MNSNQQTSFVPRRSLKASTCRNCGTELKTHCERQEEFCSNLRCRPACLAELRRKAKDAEQRQVTHRDARSADTLSELRSGSQIAIPADDDAVFFIVPDNPQKVVAQPEESIKEFRDHLNEIMHLAEEQIADSDSHESLQIEHESRAIQQQTSLPVINACSTCRGACCFQGKGNAFLTKDFFAWRLLNESDTSPAEMIDDYLSRIPEQAYKNSCVYHGIQGCVLPREIRGSTCNSFLCTGIHDGLRRDGNRKSLSSVAITEADGVQRIGLWNDNEERTETTLAPSDQ